ncbi:hypothetical protein Ct61P_01883 [Colletotrichum tofieldiae]|nr:hypothetical protein Ct61P_01883 [Colletotrichum tofieldiae]
MEYEMVETNTLNCKIMKDIYVVYDVHLSEGRSYHANGYLTSISYPQVAAALSAPSPRDRLQLCYKFPGLQNILSQYDETTFSEVLTQEIKQEIKTRTALYEDIVLINDEVIAKAEIVQKFSAIAWARQLENGRYEHGRVELDSIGLIGRGV